MKVYTGINLAKSFEDLKFMMNKADERANSGDEFGLPYAYGMLKGAIKGHILACTDTPSEELFPKAKLGEVDQEIEEELSGENRLKSYHREKEINEQNDIEDIL